MGQLSALLRRGRSSTSSPVSDPVPARVLLLAGGVLAISLSAWVALIVWDPGNPLGALFVVTLFVAGLALLLKAALTDTPIVPPVPTPMRYRLGTGAALSLVFLSAVIGISLAFGLSIFSANSLRVYDSDAAAFNHYNAELVLRGINPYTADNRFWDAIHQFPDVGATPLRRGRYAQSQYGPSLTQLVKDVHAELADPALRGPEFPPSSLHSYPALSFLVFVPGVWAGLPTTVFTSLLFVLGFLLAAGWGAPRRLRVLLWALLFANHFLIFWTLRGSFEVMALLPVLLAWRTLDRRWLSPVLLGLGCAVKQIAWPLVPFYAIIIWRRDGLRAACERMGVTLAAFLVPNLPFLLAAPGPWASSMLLPISLPIFPSGTGLVALSRAGLLPLFPPLVYTALELLALAALLLWFARARTRLRPEIALVVGLLPFFFAWHSATAYFIEIPTLAVYACLSLLRRDIAESAAARNTARQLSPAPALDTSSVNVG